MERITVSHGAKSVQFRVPATATAATVLPDAVRQLIGPGADLAVYELATVRTRGVGAGKVANAVSLDPSAVVGLLAAEHTLTLRRKARDAGRTVTPSGGPTRAATSVPVAASHTRAQTMTVSSHGDSRGDGIADAHARRTAPLRMSTGSTSLVGSEWSVPAQTPKAAAAAATSGPTHTQARTTTSTAASIGTATSPTPLGRSRTLASVLPARPPSMPSPPRGPATAAPAHSHTHTHTHTLTRSSTSSAHVPTPVAVNALPAASLPSPASSDSSSPALPRLTVSTSGPSITAFTHTHTHAHTSVLDAATGLLSPQDGVTGARLSSEARVHVQRHVSALKLTADRLHAMACGEASVAHALADVHDAAMLAVVGVLSDPAQASRTMPRPSVYVPALPHAVVTPALSASLRSLSHEMLRAIGFSAAASQPSLPSATPVHNRSAADALSQALGALYSDVLESGSASGAASNGAEFAPVAWLPVWALAAAAARACSQAATLLLQPQSLHTSLTSDAALSSAVLQCFPTSPVANPALTAASLRCLAAAVRESAARIWRHPSPSAEVVLPSFLPHATTWTSVLGRSRNDAHLAFRAALRILLEALIQPSGVLDALGLLAGAYADRGALSFHRLMTLLADMGLVKAWSRPIFIYVSAFWLTATLIAGNRAVPTDFRSSVHYVLAARLPASGMTLATFMGTLCLSCALSSLEVCANGVRSLPVVATAHRAVLADVMRMSPLDFLVLLLRVSAAKTHIAQALHRSFAGPAGCLSVVGLQISGMLWFAAHEAVQPTARLAAGDTGTTAVTLVAVLGAGAHFMAVMQLLATSLHRQRVEQLIGSRVDEHNAISWWWNPAADVAAADAWPGASLLDAGRTLTGRFKDLKDASNSRVDAVSYGTGERAASAGWSSCFPALHAVLGRLLPADAFDAAVADTRHFMEEHSVDAAAATDFLYMRDGIMNALECCAQEASVAAGIGVALVVSADTETPGTRARVSSAFVDAPSGDDSDSDASVVALDDDASLLPHSAYSARPLTANDIQHAFPDDESSSSVVEPTHGSPDARSSPVLASTLRAASGTHLAAPVPADEDSPVQALTDPQASVVSARLRLLPTCDVSTLMSSNDATVPTISAARKGLALSIAARRAFSRVHYLNDTSAAVVDELYEAAAFSVRDRTSMSSADATVRAKELLLSFALEEHRAYTATVRSAALEATGRTDVEQRDNQAAVSACEDVVRVLNDVVLDFSFEAKLQHSETTEPPQRSVSVGRARASALDDGAPDVKALLADADALLEVAATEPPPEHGSTATSARGTGAPSSSVRTSISSSTAGTGKPTAAALQRLKAAASWVSPSGALQRLDKLLAAIARAREELLHVTDTSFVWDVPQRFGRVISPTCSFSDRAEATRGFDFTSSHDVETSGFRPLGLASASAAVVAYDRQTVESALRSRPQWAGASPPWSPEVLAVLDTASAGPVGDVGSASPSVAAAAKSAVAWAEYHLALLYALEGEALSEAQMWSAVADDDACTLAGFTDVAPLDETGKSAASNTPRLAMDASLRVQWAQSATDLTIESFVGGGAEVDSHFAAACAHMERCFAVRTPWPTAMLTLARVLLLRSGTCFSRMISATADTAIPPGFSLPSAALTRMFIAPPNEAGSGLLSLHTAAQRRVSAYFHSGSAALALLLHARQLAASAHAVERAVRRPSSHPSGVFRTLTSGASAPDVSADPSNSPSASLLQVIESQLVIRGAICESVLMMPPLVHQALDPMTGLQMVQDAAGPHQLRLVTVAVPQALPEPSPLQHAVAYTRIVLPTYAPSALAMLTEASRRAPDTAHTASIIGLSSVGLALAHRLFTLFDADGDGVLRGKELLLMWHAMSAWSSSSKDPASAPVSPDGKFGSAGSSALPEAERSKEVQQAVQVLSFFASRFSTTYVTHMDDAFAIVPNAACNVQHMMDLEHKLERMQQPGPATVDADMEDPTSSGHHHREHLGHGARRRLSLLERHFREMGDVVSHIVRPLSLVAVAWSMPQGAPPGSRTRSTSIQRPAVQYRAYVVDDAKDPSEPAETTDVSAGVHPVVLHCDFVAAAGSVSQHAARRTPVSSAVASPALYLRSVLPAAFQPKALGGASAHHLRRLPKRTCTTTRRLATITHRPGSVYMASCVGVCFATFCEYMAWLSQHDPLRLLEALYSAGLLRTTRDANTELRSPLQSKLGTEREHADSDEGTVVEHSSGSELSGDKHTGRPPHATAARELNAALSSLLRVSVGVSVDVPVSIVLPSGYAPRLEPLEGGRQREPGSGHRRTRTVDSSASPSESAGSYQSLASSSSERSKPNRGATPTAAAPASLFHHGDASSSSMSDSDDVLTVTSSDNFASSTEAGSSSRAAAPLMALSARAILVQSSLGSLGIPSLTGGGESAQHRQPASEVILTPAWLLDARGRSVSGSTTTRGTPSEEVGIRDHTDGSRRHRRSRSGNVSAHRPRSGTGGGASLSGASRGSRRHGESGRSWGVSRRSSELSQSSAGSAGSAQKMANLRANYMSTAYGLLPPAPVSSVSTSQSTLHRSALGAARRQQDAGHSKKLSSHMLPSTGGGSFDADAELLTLPDLLLPHQLELDFDYADDDNDLFSADHDVDGDLGPRRSSLKTSSLEESGRLVSVDAGNKLQVSEPALRELLVSSDALAATHSKAGMPLHHCIAVTAARIARAKNLSAKLARELQLAMLLVQQGLLRQERIRAATRASHRLFDLFLVIGRGAPVLSSSQLVELSTGPDDIEFLPIVQDRLPLSDWPGARAPSNVGSFVFPRGLFLSTAPKPPSVHTWTSTFEDGTAFYFTALTRWEPMDTLDLVSIFHTGESGATSFGGAATPSQVLVLPRWLDVLTLGTPAFPFRSLYSPRALVLVSRHPVFTTMRHVLSQILRMSISSPLRLPLEQYIAPVLFDIPLPPRGYASIGFTLADHHIVVARPPGNQLPLLDVPMMPLFQCLSMDNLLLAFSALLANISVVLVSQHVVLLNPVAHVLRSLLWPLPFAGGFTPVNPFNMLDVVTSPVAGIYGVHGAVRDLEDAGLDLSFQVVADLDNNVMLYPRNASVPIPRIPEKLRRPLVKALQEYAYGIAPATGGMLGFLGARPSLLPARLYGADFNPDLRTKLPGMAAAFAGAAASTPAGEASPVDAAVLDFMQPTAIFHEIEMPDAATASAFVLDPARVADASESVVPVPQETTPVIARNVSPPWDVSRTRRPPRRYSGYVDVSHIAPASSARAAAPLDDAKLAAAVQRYLSLGWWWQREEKEVLSTAAAEMPAPTTHIAHQSSIRSVTADGPASAAAVPARSSIAAAVGASSRAVTDAAASKAVHDATVGSRTVGNLTAGISGAPIVFDLRVTTEGEDGLPLVGAESPSGAAAAQPTGAAFPPLDAGSGGEPEGAATVEAVTSPTTGLSPNFNSHEIRMAFVRFFVAALKHYRQFVTFKQVATLPPVTSAARIQSALLHARRVHALRQQCGVATSPSSSAGKGPSSSTATSPPQPSKAGGETPAAALPESDGDAKASKPASKPAASLSPSSSGVGASVPLGEASIASVYRELDFTLPPFPLPILEADFDRVGFLQKAKNAVMREFLRMLVEGQNFQCFLQLQVPSLYRDESGAKSRAPAASVSATAWDPVAHDAAFSQRQPTTVRLFDALTNARNNANQRYRLFRDKELDTSFLRRTDDALRRHIVIPPPVTVNSPVDPGAALHAAMSMMQHSQGAGIVSSRVATHQRAPALTGRPASVRIRSETMPAEALSATLLKLDASDSTAASPRVAAADGGDQYVSRRLARRHERHRRHRDRSSAAAALSSVPPANLPPAPIVAGPLRPTLVRGSPTQSVISDDAPVVVGQPSSPSATARARARAGTMLAIVTGSSGQPATLVTSPRPQLVRSPCARALALSPSIVTTMTSSATNAGTFTGLASDSSSSPHSALAAPSAAVFPRLRAERYSDVYSLAASSAFATTASSTMSSRGTTAVLSRPASVVITSTSRAS